MNTSRPSLAVFGAGRLARTLARLWQERGIFEIRDVLSPTPGHAQEAVDFIGAGRAVQHVAQLRCADVYLLGTPDDRIVAGCAALADADLLKPDSIVFHCSGALRSAELTPALHAGAAVASVHPIRSFAVPEQVVQSFAGTWCGIEGDPRAVGLLEAAFCAIGAQPVAIDAEHKMLYHSAAVFASNYLVTLVDVGVQAYAKAGIPRESALRMLEPLVRKTVDDLFRIGPEQALQGPIARGDTATVRKQYRAVTAWDTRFGGLYRRLAILTADLAARKRAGGG
jgi:predicted short-subunit dehydrogenase-like oxidoreductase (DUF2520 family)